MEKFLSRLVYCHAKFDRKFTPIKFNAMTKIITINTYNNYLGVELAVGLKQNGRKEQIVTGAFV